MIPQVETIQNELRAIVALAAYPEQAGLILEGIRLSREDFSDPVCSEAFRHLLASTKEGVERQLEAYDLVKSHGLTMDEFVNLLVNVGFVESSLKEVKRAAISRKSQEQTAYVFSNVPSELRSGELAKIAAEMDEQLRIVNDFQVEPTKETAIQSDVATFPEELMEVPGFVKTYADYIYKVSPRPNKVLSFAGALAMMSHLAGRKYIGANGATPNVYLVALANSGVGKDAPRKANKRLADLFDAVDTVADQVGSGQGLEDALFESPSTLFQMDEFDTILNAMKEKGSISEHLYTYLLTFFSESATTHSMRKKMKSEADKLALMTSTKTGRRTALKIYYPTLTLFATAIPDRFYKALTLRALESGLLARCLVFEASKRGAANPNDDLMGVLFPDLVIDYAHNLFERMLNQPIGEQPELRVVPYAPEAPLFKTSIVEESDKLYAEAEKKNDRAGMAVWNRAIEIIERLALVYALSENLFKPVVSVAALNWAKAVVFRSARRMLSMVESYVVDGRVEENAMAIYRYLTRDGNRMRGVSRSELSNNTHLAKKDLDEAIDTLKDREMIDETRGHHGRTIYHAKITKGRK